MMQFTSIALVIECSVLNWRKQYHDMTGNPTLSMGRRTEYGNAGGDAPRTIA